MVCVQSKERVTWDFRFHQKRRCLQHLEWHSSPYQHIKLWVAPHLHCAHHLIFIKWVAFFMLLTCCFEWFWVQYKVSDFSECTYFVESEIFFAEFVFTNFTLQFLMNVLLLILVWIHNQLVSPCFQSSALVFKAHCFLVLHIMKAKWSSILIIIACWCALLSLFLLILTLNLSETFLHLQFQLVSGLSICLLLLSKTDICGPVFSVTQLYKDFGEMHTMIWPL